MTDDERTIEAYINTLTDEECAALWTAGQMWQDPRAPPAPAILRRAYAQTKAGDNRLSEALGGVLFSNLGAHEALKHLRNCHIPIPNSNGAVRMLIITELR